MAISISSAVALAELQGVLSLLPGANVVISDANGVTLATFPLSSSPGVVFQNHIIATGFPTAVAASSGCPVGAIPASASIVSSAGIPMIQGIPVFQPGTAVAMASSQCSPGDLVGVLGVEISSGAM